MTAELALGIVALEDTTVLEDICKSMKKVSKPEQYCLKLLSAAMHLTSMNFMIDVSVLVEILCKSFDPLLVFSLCREMKMSSSPQVLAKFVISSRSREQFEEQRVFTLKQQLLNVHSKLTSSPQELLEEGRHPYKIVHVEEYLKLGEQHHNLHSAKCLSCSLPISADGSSNDILKSFSCGHVHHVDCYDYDWCQLCQDDKFCF
jgi:hypothetical protein